MVLEVCTRAYFVNGKRFGPGKISLGEEYIGEWEDGLMHGMGYYNDSNRAFYIGKFLRGKGNCEGMHKQNIHGEIYKQVYVQNELV